MTTAQTLSLVAYGICVGLFIAVVLWRGGGGGPRAA